MRLLGPRHDRRRPLIMCLIVVLGILPALAACGMGRPSSQAGVAQQPPPNAFGPSLSAPIAPDASYRTAAARQIAGALRLDQSELRTRLQADSSATLMTLAKPLGLAQDQLAEIVLAALNDAGDLYVRSGNWSQKQAEAEKAFWAAQTQGDLVAEVSRWLRDS